MLKNIACVFEGVMTIEEVTLNGLLVGLIHKGCFNSFKCNITKHLCFEGSNSLTVRVKKTSENQYGN